MTLLYHLPIKPCPKPRETVSDRWNKRPCVQRHREFRDSVNRFMSDHSIKPETLPERLTVIFYLPFPKSKPKKWKAENNGQGHKQRPDADNLVKAFLDAWFRDAECDDSHIWDVRGVKVWAYEPAIEVHQAERLGIESE
ncbi:MAG: RusA family crossover junction endodeoxyribonuclease [Cyanobacteria bacterium P01_F01_bin.150]